MEKPARPRFEDFGLTEEKHRAVTRSTISAWASEPGCRNCRKVRQGIEYVIRTIADTDYRARQRYDEALSSYEIKLNQYYEWVEKFRRS